MRLFGVDSSIKIKLFNVAMIENSKRIAKNTLMLYIRMLLIMLVTLYTSRMVLQVLGVEDFGIFNIVGGVCAILSFFVSSLSNATQRYLNIGLGKNDLKETEQVFGQSITLMFWFSLVLLIIGETAGVWFVENKLVIPEGRMDAARWVYQFTLFSVALSINQVSFVAAIVARERMNVYAYLGLFEAFTRLGIVCVLLWVETDHLILYGASIAFVALLTFIFHVIYCVCNFPECYIRYYWNRELVKVMSRFVGYNLFGCFSYSAGIEGLNIILNIFFGPVVNAARAIAVQVSGAIYRFTDNVMVAIKPQIIKSYASGEYDYMMLLLEKSSKYSLSLALILCFPILFETEFILNLWLGQVPEYTVSFTRIALIEALLGVLIPPLWIVANATGKIRNNQVYGRIITLLVLPISYLVLRIEANAVYPMIVLVFIQLGYVMYCLYDIHQQIGLDLKKYFTQVIWSGLKVAFPMFLLGIFFFYLLDVGVVRFLLLSAILMLSGSLSVYFILSQGEKQIVLKGIVHFLKIITMKNKK